jgi:hypothetical protein
MNTKKFGVIIGGAAFLLLHSTHKKIYGELLRAQLFFFGGIRRRSGNSERMRRKEEGSRGREEGRKEERTRIR